LLSKLKGAEAPIPTTVIIPYSLLIFNPSIAYFTLAKWFAGKEHIALLVY